jgi:phosphoribosyl 1,2-cyclic phosphate phosphodiesterase
MRLTYFGTAAAEGFPALFCHCPHCREARRLGGKNIRTRSQALINADLLIDFPPDTYMHFLQNAVEGDRIAYLLITHTHLDHFAPAELILRRHGFAADMRVPTLQILCSAEAARRIGTPPHGTALTVLEPYRTVTLGGYRITPLPARHEDDAVIYLIEEGNTAILYAHDTGYPYDEVIAYLERRHIRLDLVSLDCTNVEIPIGDDGRHMGLPNIGRLLLRLAEGGIVDDKTIRYINHFSHNAAPLQELLEKKAAAYGCLVAYDGCTVEIAK